MAQAGEISILVSVDSKGVEKGIRSSSNQLKAGAKELNQNAKEWAKWGAAASAAAATVAAAVFKSSVSATREMRNQAIAANATLAEFQAQAFAVRSAGIEQDKYADILKDVNDRVGDFLSTGGGEMAEFFERIAPKVGVTAEQFRNLSGPQALQLYVDTLDRANLSQAEMTFFMEAMANDSTRLIPLLRDGGKAMGEQASEAERLGIVLSDVDVAQLELAARSMDRVGGLIGGLAKQASAQLAPVITAVSEALLDLAAQGGDVGDEMEEMLDRMIVGGINVASTFRTVVTQIKAGMEDVWSGFTSLPPWAQEVGVLGALMGGRKGIAALALFSKAAEDTKATAAWFAALTQGDIGFAEWLAAGPEEARERLKELGHDIDKMSEQAQGPSIIGSLFGGDDADDQEWADNMIAKYREGVAKARAAAEDIAANDPIMDPLAGIGGEGAGGKYSPEENEKFLEGLRERFASERELIQMNLESEMEQLRAAKENELLTEQEFQKRKNQLQADAAKQSADIAKSEARARLQTMSSMMGNLSNLMNTGSRKMFEIGKAAAIAQAVVDGYAAVVGAYKVGASQGGPWLGAAYAATAAASTAAQIQRISSTSFSSGARGGGTSSFSGGVPVQNTAPAQQQQGGGQGESRNVSISLTGSAFSPDSVRELIREINEQVGDGVNIMAA